MAKKVALLHLPQKTSMKKITFIALLSGMASFAQTFEWLQTPEVSVSVHSDMVGYCVAADPSGNVFFTGFKGEPYPYTDMFGTVTFNKYDSNGGLLFEKVIGGKACNHNMVCDSQGNVIMSLAYVGSITIGDITISTTNQGDRFLLAKFSPDGNLLWHKPVETEEESTLTSEMKGLTVDTNDNIYIGYGNYMDSFIDKYAPDGAKLLGIANVNVSRVTSVSVDTEGNIYAAGSCAETDGSFNGVLVPTNLQYNTFIVKYSPQGVYQWVNFVNDITCTTPLVVVRTPDEVYFSSYLFGAYDFGGISAEGPQGMFDDFFLAKLDASGTYQWVREVPGEGRAEPGKRNALTLDSDGNVYFAGLTGGTITWGNGVTTTTPLMSSDAMVLKYSPEGTVLMAVTAGGTGYDYADSITLDANGGIYLAGIANSTAMFGDIQHNGGDIYNRYPYLTKIANTTMGGNEVATDGIWLYPNPASGQIFLGGINGSVSGTIVNMLGQEVMAFITDSTMPIIIDELAAGTYLLKADGSTAIRFIKY